MLPPSPAFDTLPPAADAAAMSNLITPPAPARCYERDAMLLMLRRHAARRPDAAAMRAERPADATSRFFRFFATLR